MTTVSGNVERAIADLVTPWIAGKQHIQLVIGVLQGDRRWIHGWGSSLSEAESVPPDGTTLFEIGSVTKVFTTTLLAWLVEENRLDLHHPINQLHPVYDRLPDTVTLERLATHTSGLLRLPSNLMPAMRQDSQNPYAAYTLADLHQELQQHNGQPGKTTGQVLYSNLGVGLLGNILADVCKVSYEEAVIQTLCQPLGLNDTCITLNDEQRSRLAPAYSEDGKLIKHWDLPALAGAGALRSTANDLLTFVHANLQPPQTSLGRAIQQTQVLRHQTFAPERGISAAIEAVARWIRRSRGKPLVQHQEQGVTLSWFIEALPAIQTQAYTFAGGTGGHRSFVGFIPESQLGVVILSNYADIVASLLGRYAIATVGLKILELLHEQPSRSPQ